MASDNGNHITVYTMSDEPGEVYQSFRIAVFKAITTGFLLLLQSDGTRVLQATKAFSYFPA